MSTTALNNLFLTAVKETADGLLKGVPVLTPLMANKFEDPEVMTYTPSGGTKKVQVPVPEMPADSAIGTFTRGTDVTKATRSATTFLEVEIATHICDDYIVYQDELNWMYMNPEPFFRLKILPRLETIIRKIERAGFAQHVNLYNVVGTAGDPPDSFADLNTITVQADTQLMPPQPRYYICDPVAYGDMLSISEVKTALNYGNSGPIQQGEVPQVLGFMPKKSLYLKDTTAGWHQVGGWYDASTPVIKDDGDALAIGDTSIVVDGLAASGTNEVLEGDRFTLAGDTTIYTATAAADSNSSGAATISIYPALVADPGDGAAVTILQSGATGKYVANMLVNGASLGYGAMAIQVAPSASNAVTYLDVPGIGKITYDIFEDKRANGTVHRFQIAYGWAVGQQDNSIVVLG